MADRTANTDFYPTDDPLRIGFKANLSNGDTITIPHGVPEAVSGLNSEDDDDAIASASVSGGTITFGLVDDAGANVTSDTDIVGEVILRAQ